MACSEYWASISTRTLKKMQEAMEFLQKNTGCDLIDDDTMFEVRCELERRKEKRK